MQLRRLLKDEIEFYSHGQLKEKEEEKKEETLEDEEKKISDENLLKKLDEFGLGNMFP